MSGSEDAQGQDLGWDPALRPILLSFLTFGIYGRKQPKNLDGLTVMRLLFLSLFTSGLLILFVLLFIVPGIGDPNQVLVPVQVILGVAGVAGAAWARDRPLDVTDADRLAASYRTCFFTGISFCEVPMLIAFAITMARDELWPFLVALPFFVIGMSLTAPGIRNLARRQQRIQALGSSLSIVSALMRSMPSGEREDNEPPGRTF